MYKVMRLSVVILLVITFIASCQQSQNSPQQYDSPKALTESLPKVKPEPITAFSSVDTLYFGYLGIDTIPLDDGSFVLADPQSGFVVHIDSIGKPIKQIARTGRGPGELFGGLFLQPRPGGGFSVYDQMNNKTVFFGANLEFEKEIVMRASASGYYSKVYDLGSSGNLFTEGDILDMSLNSDSERKTNLAIINKKGDRVIDEVQLKARPYVVLGNGGASALPFAHRQLIRYKPQKQTFNTYWTGSDTLAQVNAQFDTLKTIAINIPAQKLDNAEIDSLEEQSFNSDNWKLVEERLPKEKTPIKNMRIDDQGRFWLKLSYRSDFDQWLILDSEGKSQKIVQLPKGTMLTHVSEHHLGVRMGPGTFALYEPVD